MGACACTDRPEPAPIPAPRVPRQMNPAPAGGTSVFMPGAGVRRIEDVRARRQRFEEAGTTIIREPGRVITQERGQTFLRHDENARFARFGAPISQERRGGEIWTTWARPGGGQLVSVTDLDGRLLRRIRRPPVAANTLSSTTGGAVRAMEFAPSS